ncbi:MAG: response regulator transcription factor [bacterium]|nr:response regulator transcription factor [bacterium]
MPEIERIDHPQGRTRILIVDDHQLSREGLRLQLESVAEFAVVGEAANADDGLSAALRLAPHVVLMDIDMPGVSCFDVMQRLHEQVPEVKVIILSAHKHDAQISQAIRAHAWGYAIKNEGFSEVRHAIKDVMSGRLHYSHEVLDRIQGADGQLSFGEQRETRLQSLTPREQELLVLLGQGYSLKEAGAALHVSYKTVDKHKVNLMRKLDIHDRVELARFAIREHIVQP